jgi:hypothetical protein
MNRLNSNDLLSFDFLHDNPGNKQFFRNNEIYNLNDSSKFKINSNLLEKEIYENIEQYVKDLMFNNFEHENHEIIYNYSNTDIDVQISKSDEYILIFDNMQCNIKNIINIQMLLLEPIIYIYIPFILCCENINVNKKDNENDENNDDEQYENDNIKNIQDSYNKLKNKIIIGNKIKIIESNFYNENNELKEEYIYESLLIGFDYKKNKLLNFRNINSFDKITEKTKELLNNFIDFINLINDFESKNYDFIEFKKIMILLNLKKLLKKLRLMILNKLLNIKN